MSTEALYGFFELDLKLPLDGTAELLFLYLALRHNMTLNAAYPGLKRICDDLSLSRGRAVDGIKRLKERSLVTIGEGTGPRGTNLYQFPWLPNQSGGPDPLTRSGAPDPKGVGRKAQRGRVEGPNSVGSARPKNSKTIKTGQPPCAPNGAGGRSDVDHYPSAEYRTDSDRVMVYELEKTQPAGDNRNEQQPIADKGAREDGD